MLRRLFSERPLRLPRLRPYVPKPSDPAIFWFNSERDDIVDEVVRRVCSTYSSNGTDLEVALNDACYHEVRRLEAQHDSETKDSLGRWRSMIRRIGRMSDTEKRRTLDTIVNEMARDVAGNFDPRVYNMANHVIPSLITGVMQPTRLPQEIMERGSSVLDSLLEVQGNVERLRALTNKGTLVYVPTHSSNLDSVVLGQSLETSGLPPVIYGAGKNLFSNPIISFFMHNLGAYRVDRRIRVALYKDVLKTYSQVMIERGYHALFFPGGTRSRSGMIEERVKLGLLGSAMAAFTHNQVRHIDRPVWFVPTTINYALVLEAETLIKDWLTEEGKARYIIEDDEFSRIDRWVSFLRKVVGLHAACVIRFGTPIDPFGNEVDEDGQSRTRSGRVIDPGQYVAFQGGPTIDHARDAAYTRELGEILSQRYREETVIMGTQLVAHVLFRELVRNTPDLDLFARVRQRGEFSMSWNTLIQDVGTTRDRLIELQNEGQTRLSAMTQRGTPEQIVQRALSMWSGYHTATAAEIIGNDVNIGDPTLLLYYQNRLVPFAEALADDKRVPAAREIAHLGGP